MTGLRTEIDGAVARITFDRPEARNALTGEMVAEMAAFLARVECDPAVRCVVMTGTGQHFMAGGDIGGFAQALEGDPAARQADFQRRAEAVAPIFAIMTRMPQPVVAKVRGAVAGAGVGWVAASDFVLAAPDAVFTVAHVRLGLSPDAGVTWLLSRALGIKKAKAMALLAAPLSAVEALAAGLIDRVVDNENLDVEVEALVCRLVAAPTAALAETKRLINEASDRTLQAQMQAEAEAFGRCAATPDFLEGVSAFLEKRRAVFN